jgi:hypothetical protein
MMEVGCVLCEERTKAEEVADVLKVTINTDCSLGDER